MNDLEPIFLTPKEFAGLLRLSQSAFYTQLSLGAIGPVAVKFGRSRRYNRVECTEWIASDCPNRSRWQQIRGGRRHATK